MSLESFLKSFSEPKTEEPSIWEQSVMKKILSFENKKSNLLPGAETGWVTAPEVGLNTPVRSDWWELETKRWSQPAVRLSMKGKEWWAKQEINRDGNLKTKNAEGTGS